ncbi:MAG: hypothetical protein U0802_08750 [Candidatus Binatia bacterium]
MGGMLLAALAACGSDESQPRPTPTPTPSPGPRSVARQWDEEALAAIRIDFPRPPVHARNLFHFSVAMWDAWAAYDASAVGYLTSEKHVSAQPEADRAEAISYAAYRVLSERYRISPNGDKSLASLRARLTALGYDPSVTTTAGDSPAAVGNRVAAAVIAYGLKDGSNEAGNYADPSYQPANEPLIVELPGTTMADPNRWQPLALSHQVSQNGIPIPGKVQVYVAPQWANVLPFAVDFDALVPGPPPPARSRHRRGVQAGGRRRHPRLQRARPGRRREHRHLAGGARQQPARHQRRQRLRPQSGHRVGVRAGTRAAR